MRVTQSEYDTAQNRAFESVRRGKHRQIYAFLVGRPAELTFDRLIGPIAAGRVVDFDDPKVRVAAELARDIVVSGFSIDRFAVGRRGPRGGAVGLHLAAVRE